MHYLNKQTLNNLDSSDFENCIDLITRHQFDALSSIAEVNLSALAYLIKRC